TASDPIVFTITRSVTTTTAITINLTWTGTATLTTDYTLTAGNGTLAANGSTITLAAGVTSATITLTPVDDSAVEGTENVTLTLAAGSGYTVGALGAATGTIADNDTLPTLSISSASTTEGNGGKKTVSLTVTLSAVSTSVVTVAYATADLTALASEDYVATSGTLTFAPGQTSQTISVQVNGDRTLEADEIFQVTLSAPSSATIALGTGFITILNDDRALMAATTSLESTEQTSLRVEEATPLLMAAVELWASSGVAMGSVGKAITLTVADLPDGILALTSDTAIILDLDAAGYGWFVDATPLDSSEYVKTESGLAARPNSDAYGRMDLLTVLAHEVGHALGYEHTESGLMSEYLTGGARKLDVSASDDTVVDIPIEMAFSGAGRKRIHWMDDLFA
ncbi:MAG TPA: Calx-beta domain-containing protein, partial [Terriglobia bacterium]|nr:Calx-beta domain-containing protein [Terriglobia bacterium]